MTKPDPIVALAASAARALSAAAHSQFHAALADPHHAQTRVLARICQGLERTAYGARYRVTANMSYADFAAALPVVKYDALAADIADAEAGAPDVLWPGPIRHWESTSGSSGVKKRIPITPDLRRAFSHAIHVWAHDLLAGPLRPRTGKLFMAIAPPAEQSLTHEAGFVSGPLGIVLRAYLIAPPHLADLRDPESFRRALAMALLQAEGLELVSLWNPSYLLALMELIAAEPQHFVRAAGLSPQRADALHTRAWNKLWPNLQIISAWDSAAATAPAARLRQHFPNTLLQGKGLLTTETPVTIPLIGAPAPLPLIDSVLIELQRADGETFPLTRAAPGETNRLIVSTPGGFARYDLGDLVRVCDGRHQTPGLEFVGRGDAICDLVGEKLHETLAHGAIGQTMPDAFALLVPRMPAAGPAHYILLAESAPDEAGARIDAILCQGHHYRRARDLAQLGAIEIQIVPRLRERYFNAMAEQGQRLDSIKDRALITDLAAAGRLLQRLKADVPRPPPSSP